MRHVKRFKAPLLLCFVVSAQQGCGMPGPKTDPESIQGLERFEVGITLADESAYSISVLRAGDDTMPRVIYVHGTPGEAANWLDYLAQPVAGFEAVAIDRPGFGQSGPGKSVVRLEDQAGALEPLLIERRGVKPILVGHSLGGPIIAKAATMYPDRIGAIVIAAGALDPDLEKVLLIQSFGNLRLVSWMLPKWARHSNQELIALEEELREMQPQLAEIDIPIVIIHGTSDKLVPYANVPFMQSHFQANHAAETITLDDGDHFLIWNQSEQVRGAIMRAIELMGDADLDAVPVGDTGSNAAPQSVLTNPLQEQ